MFDLKKVVLRVQLMNKPVMDMEIDCTKHTNLVIRSIVGKIVTVLSERQLSVPEMDQIKMDLIDHINRSVIGDEKYKALSSPASPNLTIHPSGSKMFLIYDREYRMSVTRHYGNKESWSE